MTNLTKKYIVVYNSEKEIILKEIENTGHVYPGFNCLFFETDNLQEFENYINQNNLIDVRNI